MKNDKPKKKQIKEIIVTSNTPNYENMARALLRLANTRKKNSEAL